ncbi:MAG: metallophosphoesterase family protein, partial [bacterium]
MKDKHGSAALTLLLCLLPAAYIISCQPDSRNSTGKIQKEASARLRPPKTPDNYTVAFIGDQGPRAEALAVLELIKNEGADAVVHSGDFDYEHNPAAWEAQINAMLGADFPYFACVGNHDKSKFYGAGGYQEFMTARMKRLGLTWEGNLGVKSSFVFNGIFFVLTGPGVFGS